MPQSWLPEGKKLRSVCYRKSRDGDIWKGNPNNFHNNCDNKGPTLIVIKDTKGYVFGGYLSVSWTGSGGNSGYKKDPDAWLFALKNFAQIGPTKLPFKKGSAYSHEDYSDRGPVFYRGITIGWNNGRFQTGDQYTGSKNTWWPAEQEGKRWITGAGNYKPAEIEVYLVW